MNAFSTSLKHNFNNLTRFSGRDTRIRFWPYIGFIFALQMIIGMPIMMSIMINKMLPKMMDISQSQQSGVQYDSAENLRITHEMNIAMIPVFHDIIIMDAIIMILTLALFSAAVTRRLHDTGKPGWIGLIPVAFLISGLFIFDKIFSTFMLPKPDMTFFLLGFANNAIYLISLIILIVFLATKGSAGPNRFGDAQQN